MLYSVLIHFKIRWCVWVTIVQFNMICEYYRFSGVSLRVLLVSALTDPFTKWIIYQKYSLVLEASPELNQ